MSNPKVYKENEEEFMYLKMRNDDSCKYLRYAAFIKNHLESKNRRLVKIFDEFCDLIIPLDSAKDDHYRKVKEYIKYETNLFVNKPRMNYLFSINKKVPENDIPDDDLKPSKLVSKEVYSFEKMIDSLLNSSTEAFEKYNKKPIFARHCYRIIDAYTKNDSKIRKLYSHYKIGVIVGFITYKFGYKPSKEMIKKIKYEEALITDNFFSYVNKDIEALDSYENKKQKK